MTEKCHSNFRKKGAERKPNQRKNPDEGTSNTSNMVNFTQLFKSLSISSDSQNSEAFEDQKLMSEIGKLFFTSMVKFSHILNSYDPKSQDQHSISDQSKSHNTTLDLNKGQNRRFKKTNQSERAPNTELSSDNASGDHSLTGQYRNKNKTKKNKNNSQKFGEISNLNESLECTKKFGNNQKYTNKVLDRDKVSKDKVVSSEKPLPTTRDQSDYSLATQFEHLDSNFSDFQAPTPDNQSDEKQKLNLNIYRFINSCVSLNESSTTDTFVSNTDQYSYPILKQGNFPKDRPKTSESYSFDQLNTGHRSMGQEFCNRAVNKSENYDMETDEDKLLMRCFGGDLDSVKKLKGCDLEFVDQVGRSAIHYACTSGNLDLVKYLISNNVDIDKKDVKGWTPLFISIVKNHVQIVKLLLDHGADLSLTLRHRCAPTRLTDSHSNAIHFAAIKSNKEITELLLNRNVDVNEKDSQGITPLSYACYRGNVQYVDFLLERGANPSIQDVNRRTSFHSTALGGSMELAKLLHEKVGIQNTQDRWSLTPSKLAQIRGFTDLSEFLKQASYSNPLDSSTMSIDSDDSDDMYLLLSSTIASALNESNSDQIHRCLIRLGPDVVKTLFELTLKVEKNGGVTTADGKRHRTPGGVFFTLLKQMHINNYITKEDYQYIRAAEKERLKSQNHKSNVVIGTNQNSKGRFNKNQNVTGNKSKNENSKKTNKKESGMSERNKGNRNSKVVDRTKNLN